MLGFTGNTFRNTHRPIGILKAVYGDNGIYQCRMRFECRAACESVGGKSLSLGSSQPNRRVHHKQASKQESELHAHTRPELRPHRIQLFIHARPQFPRHKQHATLLSAARSYNPPIHAKHHLNPPACNESLQEASSSFLFFVDLEGFPPERLAIIETNTRNRDLDCRDRPLPQPKLPS